MLARVKETLDTFTQKEQSPREEAIAESLQQLPEEWVWKKLEEIARINQESRSPSEKPNEEFIYVDISGVEGGSGRIAEVKKIPGRRAPSRARRVIHANDVVMSTVRPYLKSFAVVPEEYDNQICSTGFAVLTCREGMLPKYLLYVLFSDIVINQCNEMMIGAHYPALKKTQVARIKIPVPPFREQERIVSRIEEILSKVEQAKKLREEAVKDVEAVMQSALHEVFSKAEEKGWKWKAVRELSHKLQYGYTAPAQIEPVGPRMLRITDIQDGRVSWEKVPYCKINHNEFQKYELARDDILFARSGATTGKTFLVRECPKAVFASYLIRLRVLREKVVPKYVYAFFQSPEYWKQVNPRGGAQPNMNARILASLKIPIPPLEEQERIALHFDELQGKVEALRNYQRETRGENEALTQTVLRKAFSGNLIV